MRHFLLFLVLVIGFTTASYGQTYVFQEDFEGTTLNMTSVSLQNNNAWAVTNTLAASGQFCDS
ncbi:MAG: hypothetical protein JXR34_08170, partial [Bacteroidales bacterium]|nr:hypothetical protein [Bacteroidales bacterium]